MFNWLLEKYDNLIYRIAYKPISRICMRDTIAAYMLELWITEFNKEHPPTQEQKNRATFVFLEAMCEQGKGK